MREIWGFGVKVDIVESFSSYFNQMYWLDISFIKLF